MKKLLILAIGAYQKSLSKVFVYLFGHGCRFDPTCSVYSKKAIDRLGVLKGINLSIKRIIRCHPLYKGDRHDPVPIK
jgi:putative membrane protein insertion efficiency factor